MPRASSSGVAARWFRKAIFFYAGLTVVAAILMGEISVHLPRRKLDPNDVATFRSRVEQLHASIRDTTVTAADGTLLRGWYVQPLSANGKSVVLLHGVTRNRLDMTPYAEIFLRHGYSVLMPDSRAHGESGGSVITYGLRERDDVRRWVDWLGQRAPGCRYLLGESLGAGIGLQAAVAAPQLCAVAVEDPYADYREVSLERLGHFTHMGAIFWRTLGRPSFELSILYDRMLYGVNLLDAEPKAAIQESSVPSLLITGTADTQIPMHNAEDLENLCTNHCSLWIVPRADHEGAINTDATQFEQRVMSWFDSHDDLKH